MFDQVSALTYAVTAIGAVVFVLIVVMVVTRFWPSLVPLDVRTKALLTEQLMAEVSQLKGQVSLLLDQLVVVTARAVKAEEIARDARKQVHDVNGQLQKLTFQLESKKVIDKGARSMVVMGIWPTMAGQTPLDQQGEADALYDSGYQYTALRGERANRVGVILEIDRLHPTIVQVGGHGTSKGILLSDGLAEPGYWGEAVADKDVQLMVLLSCESSNQDGVNVADALIRVGVKAVISCDEQIGDKVAVRFAQLLYAKLSESMPLAKAFARAKLALPRADGDQIRLRESSAA